MYNKAILIGRLTADPELKQTPNGVSVCSFSIACDRAFSGRNGERQTDFINIVTWRQQAEFVSKYFSKGSPDRNRRLHPDPQLRGQKRKQENCCGSSR